MIDYKENVDHLAQLKFAGFTPESVLDIGVSNGEFYFEMAKIWPTAEYYLFEARGEKDTEFTKNLKEFGGSSQPSRIFFNTVLSSTPGEEKTFYEIDAGSSLYSENTKLPRTEKKVITTTLDKVIHDFDLKIDGPTFMKIDTQGSELDIINGGLEVLKSVEVLQLEVALLEYNAGAPLVYTVMDVMDTAGFALYNLAHTQFRRQSDFALFHTDFVFVRKDSKLREYKSFWNEKEK